MTQKKKKQQKKRILQYVSTPRDGMAVIFAVACNVVLASVLFMTHVTQQETENLVARTDASLAAIQRMYAPDVMQARKLAVELYGYPMAQMVPYLAKKDPQVAAFLVAIAKKESAWGKRAPVLNGNDCYNYWGFRQERARMGSGGHTCFDSPQDAVNTVAARIQDLIDKKYNTPQKMVVVWKCGYSCQGHTDASVAKWVSDVSYHYNRTYRNL